MIQVGALDPDGNIVDRPKFNRISAGYVAFDRANGVARQ
jgi:hypothetical protein